MKKFDNFSSFHEWVSKVKEQAKKEAVAEISRQLYMDSQKYIYIDTMAMYKTGLHHSNFNKGLIILRAPQVKWLYYTTWIRPRYNMNAVPQWFEATYAENRDKYRKIYLEKFNKAKKEV